MTVLDIDFDSLRIVGKVPCGIPETPFFDVREEECQNFHEYARLHRKLTYPIVAKGDSMTGAGIYDGDVLFVDCSLEPIDGNIVLAEHNGSRTIKTYRIAVKTNAQRIELIAENPRYQPIVVAEGDSFCVIGVVRGHFREM
jgi:DNA polymerase V